MRIPEITLSGVSTGKTRHDLVVASPDMEKCRTVRLKGRYVYGKKCVRPENAGPVILTEKRQSDNAFILILAIGEKCKGTGMSVEPDQIVSCPDDAPEGIMRSSYCTDDYFVHEDLLQMQIER